MSARRLFTPSDLRKQVSLHGLALAPDGESVAYVRRTIEEGEYRFRIWRVRYDGGGAEQLTAGDVDTRPRFSPDGRTLLFLSKRSGSLQPWLLPASGGEPTRLAELEGDVGAAEWSPDGAHVLLLAPSGEPRFRVGDGEKPVARVVTDLTWRLDGAGIRDEFTSAWVVSARGGKPARVTDGGYDVADAWWSPDGSRIGFVADLRPEAALVEQPQAWAVPAAGGKPRPLAELPGEIVGARWSPGGRLAVVGTEEPRPSRWANQSVFLVERDGPRRLGADLDRPCGFLVSGDLLDPAARYPVPVHWLDDASVVTLVTDRGSCVPHRFGVDGSVERLVDADDVVCAWLAVAAGRIVATATVGGQAADVYAVEDRRLRRLTRNGGRWLTPFAREPERVGVRHRDGHELDAWLLRPPRARRRRPLVIQIHGGPHLAHGPAPWLEMLALADAGIGVLYGNARGSVGYGEAFARAIHGAWGEADASDLMQLVDWAIAEGHADPDRVGLLGLSYGGYMATWLLGRYPGRFAAAVSENPVTELVSFYGESDYGWLAADSVAGREDPWSDLERVHDRSPALRIGRNEAPLLLLQADDDLRCPPGQTDVVFATLRLLGRPVEMVRYPEESHLLIFKGRPDRRVDRLERIVGWFDRHLLR